MIAGAHVEVAEQQRRHAARNVRVVETVAQQFDALARCALDFVPVR